MRFVIITILVMIALLIFYAFIKFKNKRLIPEEERIRRQLREFFKFRIHTPMDDAIFTGNAGRITALAKEGIPIPKLILWELTSTNEPPYKLWASEALIRILIQCGADVNARYLAGGKGISGYETFETPLSNAIQAERLDLLKLFLENGADPNTPVDNQHPFRSRPLCVLDMVKDSKTQFGQEAKDLLLRFGAKQEQLGHYDGGRLFKYDE